MISWGRAFVLAIKAIVYSILWYIVGGVLLFIGVGLMGTAYVPFLYNIAEGLGGLAFIVGVITVIVSLIIMGLGSIASLIKVSVDELGRIGYYQTTTMSPPAPQYLPPPQEY
ncbi:MAG: hypothetical protein DRN04_10130 [Thermoprotei archaeon]|nr:MAG: hypothetical protein DRN04_10130 [Thermoprotei archaeon]